jgi:hypothetical protein
VILELLKPPLDLPLGLGMAGCTMHLFDGSLQTNRQIGGGTAVVREQTRLVLDLR